ncbi:tape measure protein [Azospirillum thiophilum]|nr:tape measure protein [Azospirillum thiophilum]
MTIALFPFAVVPLSSSTMKVAFQFVADAAGLVGGIRVAREEMEKLNSATGTAGTGLRQSTGDAAEAAKGVASELRQVGSAANEAGAALDRGLGSGAVTAIGRQRQAAKGLGEEMGAVSARAAVLQQSVLRLSDEHTAGAATTAHHRDALAGFADGLDTANDNTLTLSSAISGLKGGLALLFSAMGGEVLRRYGVQAIETRKQIELLEIRLRSLTGSAVDYADTQSYLGTTADRFNADQLALTQTYTQLLELKRADLVTTGQARALLEGFVNIQKATGASTDTLSLSLQGMAQGFSSGVLHAEELAQVTEPLPGLMQALDRASGNTAGGFRRMVNDGKVTSSMFRDVLIKAMQDYAGAAEKAAGTIEAAETRRENALRRLRNEVGREASRVWNEGSDIVADGANWATSFLQGNSRTLEVNRLAALYKNRQYANYQLERATSADDALKYSDRLERLNRQIAEAERSLSQLGGTAEDTRRGMAEVWKEVDTGNKVTADQIAAFTEAAQAAGFSYDKGKLLTTGQADLGRAVKAVNDLLVKSPSALKDMGLDATSLTMVLEKLKEKLDPVTAAIAELNRAAATVAILPRYRDLYTLFDKATEEKGRPLDVDESADLTAAWRKKRNADSAEQVRLTNEAAAAADRLAQAQVSGNPATVAAARADQQVAEALRDGVIVQADAASYRAVKLKENMAGLAGQAGEAATASSRQARQLLEMAAATEQGGAAVAAATLKQQIENETLKVGAGAHGELAKRLTEEDAARRKLAGAQWDRDMDLQIQAAKSLAEAEGLGGKAVAAATVANQTAAQVEKEGVAIDGERAKAIGVKTAELAKWQERQNYRRSLRETDEDIALLQRELSLQGEGETIRNRTLELARAELDIRRQFPNATEDEIAALLRKHETTIRLRQEIAEQRGLWDELDRIGERAFDRIGSAITEAFVQGKASTVSWGSVAKAVMSEVIQAALQLAVINPLKNWATGSASPSLWSAVGGGQAAQGEGGLTGSLTNTALSKGAGWAADKLGLTNGIMSAVDSWGYSTLGIGTVGGWATAAPASVTAATAVPISGAVSANAATGIAAAGNTAAANTLYTGASSGVSGAGVAGGISAYLGAAGAGAFGGGLVGGALGTATNSKAVGGLSGAVAGAGSAYLASIMGISSLGGPIGMAIGAVVGAIMGMIGTQKASVGPNSSGNVVMDGKGGFRTDTALADNGADAGQMQQVTDGVATAMNTIVTGIGGKLTGGDGLNTGLLQFFAKDNKWYVTPQQGENAGQRASFGSQDEAIQYYMRESLKGLIGTGQLTGVDDDVQTALKNSKATTAEGLATDLGFAAGFRQQLDLMNASLDPTNNQIRTFTEQAKELGTQIQTNITDWRNKAGELGLATEGELTVAARRGIEAMMGLGPAVQPLTGLAAVTEQAKINVEAFTPALSALGYTAAEQTDLATRYTQKLKDDYITSVQLVQRQGAAALAGLTNPSAATSMSDRFRTSLGLDPTAKGVSGLIATMQSVETSAARGAVTMGQLQGALSQLDQALMDGLVSGEQYSTLVNSLTAAWSTASGVLGALRQGAIAVEQAIDANWRPDLDARLSDAGLSGGAIEALRPTWQAVLDGAAAGAATAAQMRTALAALDDQLRAGTVTADQHKAAVSVLTAAWQDNATAVSAAAEQVSSTWSSLLSTAVQEVAESWRSVVSDAQQAATAWGNVADSLAQASRDVMTDGTYSNLGPQGLRDAAKGEFDRLQGVIATYTDAQKAGTATDAQRTAALDAAGQLDAAGKTYLEAQRALSGDGTAYDQTLTDVRAVWDSTSQLGLTLKSAETKRAEDAQATIDRLERLTGIGSAQRVLLDQIKAAIGSGNTNMTELLALIRQTPGYQRYSAPSDVQSRWDGMSSDVQRSVAHTLGYSGEPTDAAFNDFIVANGKASQFEALVRTGAGGVDRSGVTWLEDFWARYRAALSLPEGERSSLFAGMMSEKERVLSSLPAAAFRPMYERAVQLPETDIEINIEDAARRRGIPGFKDGGWHAGGPRLVGERGMEIEATGPARYWSHEQTRDILSPKMVTVDMGPVVTAIGTVRSAVLEIGGQIAAMAARLAGIEDAIDGQAAEMRLLGNKLQKLVTR